MSINVAVREHKSEASEIFGLKPRPHVLYGAHDIVVTDENGAEIPFVVGLTLRIVPEGLVVLEVESLIPKDKIIGEGNVEDPDIAGTKLKKYYVDKLAIHAIQAKAHYVTTTNFEIGGALANAAMNKE